MPVLLSAAHLIVYDGNEDFKKPCGNVGLFYWASAGKETHRNDKREGAMLNFPFISLGSDFHLCGA